MPQQLRPINKSTQKEIDLTEQNLMGKEKNSKVYNKGICFIL